MLTLYFLPVIQMWGCIEKVLVVYQVATDLAKSYKLVVQVTRFVSTYSYTQTLKTLNSS